ncbi:MAG: hypothetical protein AB7K68_02440 [Bacteriovoracia bacterium]
MKNVFWILAMAVTMQAQAAPAGWLTECKVAGTENDGVTIGWGNNLSSDSWNEKFQSAWVKVALDGKESDTQTVAFTKHSSATRCGEQGSSSASLKNGAHISHQWGESCGSSYDHWVFTLPSENGEQAKQYQLECVDTAPPAKERPCVGRRMCSHEDF